MSNKTQILCNNNIIPYKALKGCWEQLSSHYNTLVKLEKQKEMLIEEIVTMKKENKNTAVQMVRLGRIIKEIKYFKQMNQLLYVWIDHEKNKLVIC